MVVKSDPFVLQKPWNRNSPGLMLWVMRPALVLAASLLPLLSACATKKEAVKPVPPEVVERLKIICSTHPCRSIREGLPPVPYVFNDLVTVYPGEKFAFTGTVREGKLVDLRYVTAEEAGPRLEVELSSSDAQSSLTIESTFPEVLKYRAGMVLEDGKGPRGTSSCPVHRAAYELWPHAIDVLLLDSFRVLQPTDAMACD